MCHPGIKLEVETIRVIFVEDSMSEKHSDPLSRLQLFLDYENRCYKGGQGILNSVRINLNTNKWKRPRERYHSDQMCTIFVHILVEIKTKSLKSVQE